MLRQFSFVAGIRNSLLGHQCCRLILVALLMMAASPALATTTVWTGSSAGGVFNDDANWSSLASPGDNPTPTDDLGIFNNATNVNGTITFDADATHFRTFIQNDAGTISFDTGIYKWTMTGFLLVGAASAPNFPNIRHIGGSIQADQLLLGTEESGPNPTLEITGVGTHFHTVRGSGGTSIGLQSDGATMLVHNGAKYTTLGQTIIGLAGSSNSKLIIDGSGTEFTGGNYLGVGHTEDPFGEDATGSRAEITNGAKGTASHILMAITPGAPNNTLLVSGPGTTLTLTGVADNDGTTTAIGRQGSNNIFQIDDGAVVSGTNRIVLGQDATSTNNQIFIDNGSLSGTSLEINHGSVSVTQGTIDLIQYFNETMMIYEGGGITAPNGASSTFTYNSGTVRSVNANINNGLPFTVGDGGASSATYHMRKDIVGARGTHNFANGLSLSSNAILSGDGNIVGNVSGAAGAQVSVGASPGIINVAGNWNNTGLEIDLELDNLSAGQVAGVQYDLLDITGAFTHGGAVSIDLSQYVGPPASQQLKLIGWTSQVGSSSATTVSFTGGSPLAFSFLADGLYVTATSSGLLGDYNNDGAVNAADYVVWRKTNINGPQGYTDFVKNFGEPGGGGAGAGGVPEPTALVLAIGFALVGSSIRSRVTR